VTEEQFNILQSDLNHDDEKSYHIQTVQTNLHDYDVEGVVVFRAFPWPCQTHFSDMMVDLLKDTYHHSRGLNRRVCKHRGSFYMNGKRQTCQASSTMSAPSEKGTDNQYYNPKIVNVGLLPLAQSFINRLAQEAQQVQQSCGQFTLHILRKVLNARASTNINVYSLCKSTIITLNFFNSLHKDCDGMSAASSKMVKEFIQSSSSQKLKSWLSSFQNLFGDKTALPLPTTCCWYPLRRSPHWTHHSYFMILDLLMAYDLSPSAFVSRSDNDPTCFGATFFGSVTQHGTSAPLWVNRDGSLVTIVCPEERLYNGAWGSSGGSSEESKLRKLQQTSL
jgi:hypothetical protein